MSAASTEPGGRGTAGAFAILSAGEIAARLLSFAAVLLLTRALGVETFGIVAFALAAVTYAELAVDFGLSFLGQLEVARERIPVADLVAAIVASRIGIGILAAGALVGFTRWADLPAGAGEATVLFALVLVARVVELDWVLLGFRRTQPVAWSTFAGEAILAIGVLATVHGPEHLLRVPLVYLAARAGRAAIVGAAAILRIGIPSRPPDPALAGDLLRQASPIAASIGCGLLFHSFDLVYVGLVRGAEASGLYGSAHRLYLLLLVVSLAYFKALRPDLGRASIGGFGSVGALFSTSLRVTGAVTVGVAVGGAVLAEPLLAFFFGPEYGRAAGVLRALLAGFVVGTAARHHSDLLVAFGHQRIELAVVAVAAGLNVVLDIVLVPIWGIEGAAWATAASACVFLALLVPTVRRRIGPVAIGLPSSPRILVPAGVLAGLLLLLNDVHVLVRVVLGGGAYVGLLFAARAVRLDDVRRLERGVPRPESEPERSRHERGTELDPRTGGP